MLPVVMLSGYAFPVANMPLILQIISNIVPAKWYIIMVKDVMIKGIGLSEIWNELLIILGMTAFFLVVSIKRFKVRLQ
jgi:ABC-2 type transport system permease protein